jgi:hypothetical protein
VQLNTHKAKILPLICLLLLAGCAVKNAPQINTETQWRLNTVSQLTDLQNNYTTFFKDAGDAQRAGIITGPQLLTLNSAGHKLKESIEYANTIWKQYVAAPDGDHKTQVINAILAAEQILLGLTSEKAAMAAGSGK